MPCSEKRAALLLKRPEALLPRIIPFTIRTAGSFMNQSVSGPVHGISYKTCRRLERDDGFGDPFSKTTEKGEPGSPDSFPGLKAGISRARG